MSRNDRAARAACLLAAGLVLAWWPEGAPPVPAACPGPVEIEADAARQTRAVRCAGEGAAGPPLRGPARLLFGRRLDPNRASAESLMALPGLGPVRAAAIVAERRRRPFRRLAELERVPGIGPRTLARIAPWLEIAPPPLARRGSSKTVSLPMPSFPPGEPEGGMD